MKAEVLILFARRLALGQVKSRLAAAAGDAQALAIYGELVQRAAELTSSHRWDAIWCLTGTGDWKWQGPVWDQISGDLGERMEAAMERAFDAGASRVVIAGTDVPDLDAAIVSRLFDALCQGVDVVTLPATDGGYGAIGMRRRPDGFFLHQAWSHDRVHEEAVVRAARRGLRICALSCLSDVDELEDWSRWNSRR